MRLALLLLCSFVATRIALAEASEPITLDNPLLRWTISTSAMNVAFVDRATGKDYLRGATPSPCARIRANGRDQTATAAALADGRLTLLFGTNEVRVVLKVEQRPSCILLTVESVSGPDVDSLVFLNVPLALKAAPGESFGACALSLNLITRVDALPALQTELRASCEKKFGLIGAKVAIVAAPMDRMLQALQETLAENSELPVCKVAGPWAREIPFNHGSYLFNFGASPKPTSPIGSRWRGASASPRSITTAAASSSASATWS